MGFCPGANFDNRLDIEWKEKGICTFIFLRSEQQLERFNDIWPGDLIVLKKRHQFGKTMLLYGHGRATGIKYDQDNTNGYSDYDNKFDYDIKFGFSDYDIKFGFQICSMSVTTFNIYSFKFNFKSD